MGQGQHADAWGYYERMPREDRYVPRHARPGACARAWRAARRAAGMRMAGLGSLLAGQVTA